MNTPIKSKVQKAFSYLLNLLNDVYETGWELSEALKDAAIEFSLDKDEAQQLQKIHQDFEGFDLTLAAPPQQSRN